MSRLSVRSVMIGGALAATLLLAACAPRSNTAAPAATPTPVPAAPVSAENAMGSAGPLESAIYGQYLSAQAGHRKCAACRVSISSLSR